MRPTLRGNLPLSRSQHRVLWLITALALALRLAYLWGQSRNNPLFLLPRVDAHWHQGWAEQIASGQGMDPEPYYRAPLYYYLLGGLYWLVGPHVLWGRLLGCALGSLTTYVTARLGFSLGGFRVGVLAGLLAAFYWPGIYFDAELLTASLESLLGASLVLMLVYAGRENGIRAFFAAGLIWGLACIARPNFLALAPVILVWLFWLTPVSVSMSRRWARGGLLALGLILVILPVTLRNFSVSGEPILITYTGGVNFYIGNNPESTGISAVIPGARRSLEGGFRDARRIPEAERGRSLSAQELSDYWWNRGLSWVRADPFAWLQHSFYKFRLFFSPVALSNNQPIWFFASLSEISLIFWVGFPLIACLALASVLLLGARWREWFLPWGFAATYAVTVIIFFVNARVRLPVYPVLIVSGAAGVVELSRRITSRSWRDLLLYGGALLLSAIFVFTNPPFDRNGFYQDNEGEGHGIFGHHYASLGSSGSEDETRALQHFEKAVRLKPGSPNLQIDLAKQYQIMKRSGEAELVLARAAKRFPDSAEVHFEYGRLLNELKRPRESLNEFQLAVRLQPAYAEAHQALGCRLGALNQATAAERPLRLAIQLDPSLLPARLCLAGVHLQQNRLEDAARLYRGVLDDEPRHHQALIGLADVAMLSESLDEAAEYYRAALRLDPALPSASQNLAAALWSLGQYRASLDALRAGLAASPSDTALQTRLAWALATAPHRDLRDGASALPLAQRAVETAPSLETIDALAAAYAELGRFEEASRTLQAGLALPQVKAQVSRATAMRDRLSLYQARRPFHQSPRPHSRDPGHSE
ncbi:MAG: tetratricopeptide repeat protein [Myxococcota bacterium]|nr:tetratricopeptide repeat protein [Myxococcota bacterium]